VVIGYSYTKMHGQRSIKICNEKHQKPASGLSQARLFR